MGTFLDVSIFRDPSFSEKVEYLLLAPLQYIEENTHSHHLPLCPLQENIEFTHQDESWSGSDSSSVQDEHDQDVSDNLKNLFTSGLKNKH
jgi:hypothetical protein